MLFDDSTPQNSGEKRIPMISALYVDDDPALLELGKIFLERAGDIRVDTVVSAPEALIKIRSVPYDIVISDYQMPGMDGIALLKIIRSTYPALPFIIFTGKGREDVVIEALNSGADQYIQKGGDQKSQFAELVHTIRRAVERKHANDAILHLNRAVFCHLPDEQGRDRYQKPGRNFSMRPAVSRSRRESS